MCTVHKYSLLIKMYISHVQEKTKLNTDNETEGSLHNVEETNNKENVNIQITKDSAVNNEINDIEKKNQSSSYLSDVHNASLDESDYETASESEKWETEDLSEKFGKLSCDPTDLEIEGENENKDLVNDILVSVSTIKSGDGQDNIESIEDEDYDNNDEDDDEDEDNGWITPGKFDFTIQVF